MKARSFWISSRARPSTTRKTFRSSRPANISARHPTNQVATPSASSWGEEGYLRAWLNETNEWIYPHLQVAQERMSGLAKKFAKLVAPGKKSRRQMN
jgi:1,4-alpha-glucan branching enzyme